MNFKNLFFVSAGLIFGSASACDSVDAPIASSSGGSASGGDGTGAVGTGGDAAGGTKGKDIDDIFNTGGDGTGGGLGGGCADAETSAELVPTNLLFVVDTSGSMKCNAPPVDEECLLPEKKQDTEPSKWESTRDALLGQDDASTINSDESGVLRTLVDTQGLSVGLITFPTDSRCEILPEGDLTTEIAKLDGPQVDSLNSALSIVPDGETPLAGAAIRGLEILRSRLVSGDITGNSYLVLMTDGVETCQPAALDDLRTFVGQALEHFDIYTYVIGAPGSAPSRSLLSELAFLGGTATTANCTHGDAVETVGDCHIDLTDSDSFAEDLQAVFSDIVDFTQASCDFDVPKDAFLDPEKVNVLFTSGSGVEETFFKDERDCESQANGWQYASDDQERIVLCGGACERVRADSGGRVDVIFGCAESEIR